MTVPRYSFSHSSTVFAPRWTWLVVCVTTALSYLVPKLARLATPNPQTVWPIWPGCAILVTGLFVGPDECLAMAHRDMLRRIWSF